MITDLRNADAMTLLSTLNDLNARKLDVTHPANAMRVVNGQLVLSDVMTEDGAWQRIVLDPTDSFLQGLSTKLDIPIAYLRRCFAEAEERNANAQHLMGDVPPLFDRDPIFDQTVNYWLAKQPGNMLVRAYAGDDGAEGRGIARAFLSDRFLTVDNLDMATAALQGIRKAGVNAELVGADLNDRTMWLKFRCPDVAVDGGEYTRNYTFRPRGGHETLRGADRPLVFAGFMVRNSEIGSAKAEIIPVLEVQVCTNGLTRNVDARGSIHLGSRQDAGIRWSRETSNTRIELIINEMADSVTHFCTPEYVQGVMDSVNEVAGVEIARPAKAAEHLIRAANLPKEHQEALFATFMGSGPSTVGNLVQAITQLANDTTDPEAAHALESAGEKALSMAGVLATA